MDAPRTRTVTKTATKTILYCRLPGLLALAARRSRPDALGPVVVSDGRLVRDACPLATAQGVRVGDSLGQARRLCPALLAIPLEAVDARQEQVSYLDVLADLSPVAEADGLDAAYADVTGSPLSVDQVVERLQVVGRTAPVVGLGASRLAARACAESGVDRLEAATVQWLWPDDPAVVGRLQRLGLATFGAVADVGEEALRLHFGRISPVLHRRAQGLDLTPVRALYPPPFCDAVVDCGDAPVDDRARLRAAVAVASGRAATRLQGLGVGRRLTLEVRTERGEQRQEWAVPAPLEGGRTSCGRRGGCCP